MTYTTLDHVGFTVSNIDRSVAFYAMLLGTEPVERKTWKDTEEISRIVGYRNAIMKGAFWELPGGVILELFEYVNPEPATVDMETYNVGNAHLCLLTTDLSSEFERLQTAGVPFRDPEPVIISFGPLLGGKACCLRDPDGITIELLEKPAARPHAEQLTGSEVRVAG